MWYTIFAGSVNLTVTLISKISIVYSENTFEEYECELGESESERETGRSVESGQNYLQIMKSRAYLQSVEAMRMCIFSSTTPEDERTSFPSTFQNVAGGIEIGSDGTQWIKLKRDASEGRTLICMIFKDIVGHTHAKRNIMVGCKLSAFDLIIDKHIKQHIKDFTGTEAVP